MYRRRSRHHHTITRGAEVIGFQLDGGEVLRALRQMREARVAAGRIGQRDYGARMQETVRRQMIAADGKFRHYLAFLDGSDDDAQMVRQRAFAELVEVFGVEFFCVHGAPSLHYAYPRAFVEYRASWTIRIGRAAFRLQRYRQQRDVIADGIATQRQLD